MDEKVVSVLINNVIGFLKIASVYSRIIIGAILLFTVLINEFMKNRDKYSLVQ